MQRRAYTQAAAECVAAECTAESRGPRPSHSESACSDASPPALARWPGPQTDVNIASSTAARSPDRTGPPGQTGTALPSRMRAPSIQVTNSLGAEIAGAADDTPIGPTEDCGLTVAHERARCDAQHGSGPA